MITKNNIKLSNLTTIIQSYISAQCGDETVYHVRPQLDSVLADFSLSPNPLLKDTLLWLTPAAVQTQLKINLGGLYFPLI